MICVIPFHAKDRALAQKQAEWIMELGNVSDFDCLLVHESNVSAAGIIEHLQGCFKSVSQFHPAAVPEADWSAGTGDARAANEMWIQTAWHIHGAIKQSWLWMEPDCVPLKPNWLKEIQEEYRNARKRVMGAKVTPSTGQVRISGVAVYPPSVMECGQSAMVAERVPWDVAGAQDFVKHGCFTTAIYHVLRTSKEAPTFPSLKELATIPSTAAIFHPCKDGTLIDRLREKLMGVEMPKSDAVPTETYIERLRLNGSEIWKEMAERFHDQIVQPNNESQELAVAKARIIELESIIKEMAALGEPTKKTVRNTKRTPEQQKALNDRMAKARAGRKKK